jgi:hypothetical protein
MTVQGFDRLRPRVGAPESPSAYDAEGKRALFSSSEAERPAGGCLVVDCSRCEQRTVLTAMGALRASFPALHLSIGIGRGGQETTFGLLPRRHYGSWLRCPACGHGSWVRVTVRL